ncbi:MAG: hypothetical protein ABEJ79_01175 [Halolamina sp.]
MHVLGGTRGQSEVLAVVLLLSITVTGTAAVVTLGDAALQDGRDTANVAAAEHGMTQFDSRTSLVAHGSSDTQRVDFATMQQGERSVEPDRGWLNVTVQYRENDTVRQQLLNVTLGAVVYERGDTTVAYQGGGVWRSTGEGSSMLSPPEFHYEGSTLTLPLVVVDGNGSVTSAARVTQTDSTRSVYPNATAGRSNPLRDGEVVIAVQSEYYEGWGRFFEQRTGGNTTVDHANETAVITLVTSPGSEAVGSALSSTAAGDELDMQGSGGDQAYVDSYDSDNGNYSDTQTANGTLLTAGSVKMSGNAKILGNVRSGGQVTLKGGANVTGEAAWTTGFKSQGSSTYGSEQEISGVDAAEPKSGFVNQKVSSFSNDNDNDATTAVDDERLNFTGGSVTVPSGEYYLEKIDASNSKDIVLDTSGGPVELALGNSMQLDPANITVTGGDVARIYVADDIQVKGGSNVSVPGQRSTGLWVYGEPDDSSITIEGSSGDPTRFVGVVYVPGTDDGDVSIKHAEVYGAVVGGSMDIQNGGVVHYDAALADESPLPAGANVPTVTYLHLSVTEVQVEDE